MKYVYHTIIYWHTICTVKLVYVGHSLGQTNTGCNKEVAQLLTQVQTHAGDFGPIITWLYYRWWPANTGTNTCYGDFGPINLAVL